MKSSKNLENLSKIQLKSAEHRENPQQFVKQQKSSQFDIDQRFNAQLLRINVQQQLKFCQTLWELTQQQLAEAFSLYKPLPQSNINIDKLLNSTNNVKLIKSSPNKIYFGQILNKKKHGIGISIYKDGRIYEGCFEMNEKSGKGIEVYSNSNIYIGEFDRNKKHGKGRFYWFNLSEIPCTKNGSVLIEHYIGNWWGGLPDGEGQHYKLNGKIFILLKGDVYVGTFKNGLKHGLNGIQYYASGDFYEGQFVNGLSEGHGSYFWKNGSTYKGDFKQGYRNGYGIWSNKNETQTYHGHYMLDKKHGYGIYAWGNGYAYKGSYSQDIRSGEGTLFHENEVIYEGLWIHGQRAEQVEQKLKGNNLFGNLSKSSKISRQTSALIKNGKIKSRIFSSKEPPTNKSFLSSSKPSRQKSAQNPRYHQNSTSKSKISQKYCISFKHDTEQKPRYGHRNCIPCTTIGRKPHNHENNRSNSKRKSLSKSHSKC